jgi:hypothetical protein
MKKKLNDFKTEITKTELAKLYGGQFPSCGQTSPNTQEQTITSGNEWDSDPDSYCDDD